MSRSNAAASSSRRQTNGTQQHSDDEAERQVKPTLDDEDDDEDDDPRSHWSRATFEDVPMSKAASIKVLREIQDKFNQVADNLSKGVDLALETGKALEEASPDDELIEEVEKNLWTILEQKEVLEIQKGVIDEVINELTNHGEMVGVEALYHTRAEKKVNEYTSKSLRAKFKDNEDYRNFRQDIWEVNHDNEACPPLSRWLPRGDDDEEGSDDEIEMGQTLVTFRCPITLHYFEDACVSTLCNHHYSYAAIIMHIEQASRSRNVGAKCPVAGCNKVLTKADIKRDPDMQRRTDARQKKTQQREEDSIANESYIDIE